MIRVKSEELKVKSVRAIHESPPFAVYLLNDYAKV